MALRIRLVAPAVVIAALAGGCRYHEPAAPARPAQTFDPGPGPEHSYLGDWEIAGPFAWQARPPVGDVTPMLERRLIASEAQLVSGRGPWPAEIEGRPLKRVHEPGGEVRLDRLLPSSEFQAAFALAEVSSPADMDAALLVESDDGVRIWVNGEPVFTSGAIRRLQQFEDYARIRLRKGSNRIAVKLVRAARRGGYWDSWAFAVGVRSLEGARRERAARNFLQELTTSVVPEGGRLGIDLRLYQGDRAVAVDILDHRRRPLRQLQLPGGQRHQVDVADLPSGVHYLLVRESAAPEPFPFFKGDVGAAHDELLRKADPLLADPAAGPNLSALVQRFAHLLEPEHRENQDHLWQAKIAMLLAEWQLIDDARQDGRPLFQDVPGTHLRGLRSRVDGSSQYYILHVPRGYQRSKGPLPLALIIPYPAETQRPFLESVPVAEISVLGAMARAADEQGLAFLWMDNRGSTHGSDFGEIDMFDALAQVSRDYAIDPDRLYLFGSCAGGRDALALAAKYPDRFAAVGTMSPVAHFKFETPEAATDRYDLVAARQKSPMYRLENLLHVPVYDLHGDQNTHSPLRDSVLLHSAAGRAGIELQLAIVPHGTHLRFPSDPRATIFRWLVTHRRRSNPDHVVLATSAMRYNHAFWVTIDRFADTATEARIEAWRTGTEIRVEARNVAAYHLDPRALGDEGTAVTVTTNGVTSFQGRLDGRRDLLIAVAGGPPRPSARVKTAEVGGPVWDVFTGPVLVVVGTAGPPEAVRASRTLADRFVASWKARYLGDVPVKSDRELNAADLRDHNLVLFGAVEPRGPLAALPGKLPFRVRHGRLEGPGGTSFDGEVSAQFAMPNPANRARYLLVAASPARAGVPVDAVQLTLKGWYDYAVWKVDHGEATVEDVGRFDPTWSRSSSFLRGRETSAQLASP
jgi:dienelactone hydrolase